MCRHEPFIDKWFGEAGDLRLKLSEFQSFVSDLHTVFGDLEFALLDTHARGSISGLDLARSFVAPASVSMIDGLLDRVRPPSASALALRSAIRLDLLCSVALHAPLACALTAPALVSTIAGLLACVRPAELTLPLQSSALIQPLPCPVHCSTKC